MRFAKPLPQEVTAEDLKNPETLRRVVRTVGKDQPAQGEAPENKKINPIQTK